MTNGLKFEIRETATRTSPFYMMHLALHVTCTWPPAALGRGKISTLAKRRELKWNGFNIEPLMESSLNTQVRKSHVHSSL